jgi:hypothetical protein
MDTNESEANEIPEKFKRIIIILLKKIKETGINA